MKTFFGFFEWFLFFGILFFQIFVWFSSYVVGVAWNWNFIFNNFQFSKKIVYFFGIVFPHLPGIDKKACRKLHSTVMLKWNSKWMQISSINITFLNYMCIRQMKILYKMLQVFQLDYKVIFILLLVSWYLSHATVKDLKQILVVFLSCLGFWLCLVWFLFYFY